MKHYPRCTSYLFLFLLFGQPLARGEESAGLIGIGDRGTRLIATGEAELDFGPGLDKLSLSEHPGDDGYLTLILAGPEGQKISNEKLVYGLDRDEAEVSSYGIDLKSRADGTVQISSVKDWGLSVWSHEYTLAAKEGKTVIAQYHYTFGSQYSHGDCSLNFTLGTANLNGTERKFKVLDNSLERADGAELIRLCQKLLAQ